MRQLHVIDSSVWLSRKDLSLQSPGVCLVQYSNTLLVCLSECTSCVARPRERLLQPGCTGWSTERSTQLGISSHTVNNNYLSGLLSVLFKEKKHTSLLKIKGVCPYTLSLLNRTLCKSCTTVRLLPRGNTSYGHIYTVPFVEIDYKTQTYHNIKTWLCFEQQSHHQLLVRYTKQIIGKKTDVYTVAEWSCKRRCISAV